MQIRTASLLLAVGLALGVALVPVRANEAAVVLPTVPELRQQIAGVKKDIGKLPAAQKVQVADAIARVESRLGGGNSYSVLSAEQQLDMVNDVALIRSARVSAENERVVCHRERAVGSNRISSICKTASEWAQLREVSRQQLHDTTSGACTGVGCGTN